MKSPWAMAYLRFAWACVGVVSREPQAGGLGCRDNQVSFLGLNSSSRTSCLWTLGTRDLWPICLNIICTSPGKSSWMEQHPATISMGSLSLVEGDRVRRPLGRTRGAVGLGWVVSSGKGKQTPLAATLREADSLPECQLSGHVQGTRQGLPSPSLPAGPHQGDTLAPGSRDSSKESKHVLCTPHPYSQPREYEGGSTGL